MTEGVIAGGGRALAPAEELGAEVATVGSILMMEGEEWARFFRLFEP